MKPRNLHILWIIAFSLKAIGASWDASFHFKYLRDTTQIPHIVNSIGLLLACFLWIYMAKQVEYKLSRPLQISGLGFVVFFGGIPIDETWHRIFGIDLTTWSPTHAILYLGTALMIVGTILKIEEDHNKALISFKDRNLFLIFQLTFFFEAFWFPQLQQEQGVISLYLFDNGIPIASKDIISLIKDPHSQIYGGIPDWLYAVYACFVCMLVFQLIRYFKIHPFSATMVASIYVAFRAGMNLIFHAVAYPESTIPYYLIVSALIFDSMYFLLQRRKAVAYPLIYIIPLIVCSVYLISFYNPIYPIHPPIPIFSAFLAIFTGLLGSGVANLLIRFKDPFHQPFSLFITRT